MSAEQGVSNEQCLEGVETSATIALRDPDGPTPVPDGQSATPVNAPVGSHFARMRQRTRRLRLHRLLSAPGWNAFASIAVALTTMVYTRYANKQWVAMSGQIEVMRQANDLTRQAARSSDQSLLQTLQKMQAQTEATNHLYAEAQKQTLSSSAIAVNSGTQARASEHNAEAAKITANTAKSSLEAQTTPWLGIDDDVPIIVSGQSENLHFNFMLHNYGNTPAQDVSLSYRVKNAMGKYTLTPPGTEASEICIESDRRMIDVLSSPALQRIVWPTDQRKFELSTTFGRFNPQEWLFGCVSWGDIAGKTHHLFFDYHIRRNMITEQINIHLEGVRTMQ